jgi:protocatechuate 3,4-dioxygenase beta subunit
MYFPGDPLIPFDPIFNCTADEKARNRLISVFDWETTMPDRRWVTGSISSCGDAKLRRWRNK